MSTPIATLLPLTSLKNFNAALLFLDWLKKTNQQGWHFLPISDPIATPYRNQGIGLASYFYDNQVAPKYRRWLIKRPQFIATHQAWLPDYALYQALSEHFHTSQWWTWPPDIAAHQSQALSHYRQQLKPRLEAFYNEQYFLTNELLHLKAAARQHEIMLIGDLSFYLAQESSLVWANQELFVLAKDGSLSLQSGVPSNPREPFSVQFWGHPLYNWATGNPTALLNLFITRLQFLGQFFDLIRLDHANGFFRYGLMSTQHPHWSKKVDGPGSDFLLQLLDKISQLKLGIYFEDLASESMRLEQFMKKTNLAGTKILTLTINPSQTAHHLKPPSDAKLSLTSLTGNKVIFSSNHDTPPLITWLKSLPSDLKARFLKINDLPNNLSDQTLANTLRLKLLSLPARLIVIAWQDWYLDTHRFNVPGQEKLTNWDYLVPIEKYL